MASSCCSAMNAWAGYLPRLCCARTIEPGPRTGRYRVGGDVLLSDAAGVSRISTSDYAVAVADELERTAHPRERMSVAY